MDIVTGSGLIVPESALSREGSYTIPKTWAPSSASADDDLLPVLADLRDKCRDVDRKECLARAATENYVTNVVGDGLRPQAK